MRRVLGVLGVLGACIGVACSASGEDIESDEGMATASELGSLFDVNDVSILFPTNGGKPVPAIKVSEGDLWTAKNFKEVTDFAKKEAKVESGSGGDSLGDRNAWHVMGLRFDPCAPGFSDKAIKVVGNKCIIQFRLIVQPVFSRDQDFSAHLVYNLGLVDRDALPNDPVIKKATELLTKIKTASGKTSAGASVTAGQPLGVHPGLKKDPGGKVSAAVRELIATFTARSQRAIAFMGLENGGPEPWNFFAGKVEGDSWKHEKIAALGGASFQGLDFISGSGPLNPKGMTSPLFASGGASKASVAFKVEDAADQHFFNTDCVSCHTSSSRMHQLRLKPTDKTPTLANITGYVQKSEAQDTVWNVRNFGYFRGKATVSGRTVTETVEVAHWFNEKVINKDGRIKDKGKAIFGAGPDCSASDEKVWTCFRDGETDCLRSCKKAPQPTDEAVDPPTPPAEPAEENEEPCVKANASKATKVTTRTFTAGGAKVRAAKLETNDMKCLTRVLGGFFASPNPETSPRLQISCDQEENTCEVSVPEDDGAVDSFVLKDAEAKRFKKFFRTTRFFQSRGTGAGVQIACEKEKDRCTVSIAADRADLKTPSGLTRLNPE